MRNAAQRALRVLTVLSILLSANGQADPDGFVNNPPDICIGSVHFRGLREGAVKLDRPSVGSSGLSRPIQITLDGASLIVYKPGTLPKQGPPCASSAAAAAKAIVQGRITKGNIKGTLVEQNRGGSSLLIDKDGFDLTLVGATLRPRPLYGGSLRESKAPLHLTNPSKGVRLADTNVQGTVHFSVPAPVLDKVSLTLDDHGKTAVTLSGQDGAEVIWAMDLSSGELRLQGGTLATTSPITLHQGHARMAGLEVDYAQGRVRSLELAANGKSVRASLRELSLKAASALHGPAPRVSTGAGSSLTIALVSAGVPEDGAALKLEEPTLSNLVLSSQELSFGEPSGGSAAVRGAGQLAVTQLTQARAKGSLKLQAPIFTHLPKELAGTSVKEVSLSFQGDKGSLGIEGTLSVGSFALGAAVMSNLALDGKLSSRGGSTFDLVLTGRTGQLDLFEGLARTGARYSGPIEILTLQGRVEPAPGDAGEFLRVPSDQLSVSLARMDSRAPSFFGADLAAQRVVMKNSTPLSAGPRLAGELQLTLDRLMLGNAKLDLGGDNRTAVSLSGVAGTTAALGLDPSSGALRLNSGTLSTSAPVSLSPGRARMAGLDVNYTQGQMGALELAAKGGSLQASLRGMSLQAARGAHEQTPRVLAGAGQLTVDLVIAAVPLDSGALMLQTPVLSNLSFSAQDLSLGGTAGGSAAVRGAGRLVVKELSQARTRGTLNLQAPTFIQLPGALSGTLVRDLELSFDGEKTSLVVDGKVSVESVALGAVVLSNVALQGKLASRGGRAFSIDLEGLAGQLDVYESVARASLRYTGAVGTLSIKGVVDTEPGAEGAFLRVPGNQLAATLARLDSRAPSLLGGDLAADGLTLTNTTALSAGPQLAGGFLLTTTSAVLTNAKIALAPVGSVATIASLASRAPSVFTIEPGAGHVRLESGDFAAQSLRASAPAFEVSGLRIVPGDLKIGAVRLTARQGTAEVMLGALELGVGRVEHSASPRFAGTLRAPARVTEARGQLPIDGAPLAVHHLELVGAAVQLSGASYESSDSFSIRNATADVSLAQLTPASVRGRLSLTSGIAAFSSQDGSGTVAVRGFTLDFAGEKAHLGGTGTLAVASFSVGYRMSVPIFKCREKLPLALSALAGQTNGSVTVTEGRLTTSLDIATLDALLGKAGRDFECDWDESLPEPPKISFVYPCPKFSEPWAWCSGWTYLYPPMSIRMTARVVQLQAAGKMEGLKLRSDGGRGLRVCGGRLTHVAFVGPPLFNVNPTITGGNILSNIVREIINGLAFAAESAIGTAVGEIGSFLVSAGVGGNVYVFGSCN